jgi:hypothetical protein
LNLSLTFRVSEDGCRDRSRENQNEKESENSKTGAEISQRFISCRFGEEEKLTVFK